MNDRPAHTPAKTLVAAYQQLSFDQPLADDDPRYVETVQVRGDFSRTRIRRALEGTRRSFGLSGGSYFLYCGHVGCGKSTELRRLAKAMNRDDGFLVIFLDILEQLDPHNLRYPDVLFALAAGLLRALEEEGFTVEPVFIRKLEHWFQERIEKQERTRELATELKTGAESTVGIPWLGKLFASLTNSFKINATYKEELRTVVKNSFSEFASAFNQLITAADETLNRHAPGRRVLFIIDGTDRLSKEDGRTFFVEDIHQLQQIESIFLYCAPISLVFDEGPFLNNIYKEIFRLPMIKLSEKTDLDDEAPHAAAYQAMRAMALRRVDRALFDADATLDRFIRFSGGNPRHLLRLLSYAYLDAEGEHFNAAAAAQAIKRFATDYRRYLTSEDYALLHRIDVQENTDDLSDDRERASALLYSGALLEYNSFWWRSHPVVRTLPGYQNLAHAPAA